MLAIVFVSAVHNPEENLSLAGGSFVRSDEYEIANDFDLRAVEAAISLKESGAIDRVVVFSAAERTTHITKALAMGADEAIWACARDAELSPQIGGDDEGRRRLKFGRSKLRFRFDDPFFALGVVV